MIKEPDQAILNKLTESAGTKPKVSDGAFDVLSLEELDTESRRMVEDHPRWIIIVTCTEERHIDWWTRGMMIYFRDGLSVVNLSDGRTAFCTWASSR